jgi:hypothetical protein
MVNDMPDSDRFFEVVGGYITGMWVFAQFPVANNPRLSGLETMLPPLLKTSSSPDTSYS